MPITFNMPHKPGSTQAKYKSEGWVCGNPQTHTTMLSHPCLSAQGLRSLESSLYNQSFEELQNRDTSMQFDI